MCSNCRVRLIRQDMIVFSEGVLKVYQCNATWMPLNSYCISPCISAKATITKYPKPGGFNNRNLFLTVVEAGSSRSSCQQGWFFSWGLFSLACRWPPSCHVLTWSALCVSRFPLLVRTPVRLDEGHPNSLISTWLTSSKVLSPNTGHIPRCWWLGLQQMNLDGHNSTHNTTKNTILLEEK